MSTDATNMLDPLCSGYEKGFIEVRAISPGSGRPVQEFFSLDQPSRVAERALELSATYNVYVGVLPRSREEGTAEAVAEARVVWADIDTPEALMALVGFELQPSIVVASGSPGCHHSYWLLDQSVSPQEAVALNRAIAARLGADMAATDAPRILRVAGTVNHKSNPPESVRLLKVNASARYTVAELEAVVGAGKTGSSAPTQAQPAAGSAEPGPAMKRIVGLVEGVRPAGDGILALCPAHDDHDPSLSIGSVEGKCVVKCFAGCSTKDVMAALDLPMAALFDDYHEGGNRRDSAAMKLLRLIDGHGIELFRDRGGVPYARFPVGGHYEVWAVESTEFEGWLSMLYFEQEGRAVNVTALKDALRTLAGQARFGDDERVVHRRIGGDLETMYLDLGDADWRVVEITAGRWRILETSPVIFLRDAAAQSLPVPVRGGSIDQLRGHINVASDDDWLLVRGLILGILHPLGPYPIGLLQGPAGSAKSTLALHISRLTDPFLGQFAVGTPTRRDVQAAALNGWLIGFDNVSHISSDLSNVSCALTTGAGVRERLYFTNAGLFVGEARRPLLFTALAQIGTRADFIDRLITARLAVIPEDERKDEQEVMDGFNADAGSIFGGILDALAAALQQLPEIQPAKLPRLASIAKFVTAAERGMGWEEGSFMAALARSRGEAMEASIHARPIVAALVAFMEERSEYCEQPTHLYAELTNHTPDHVTRSRAWPRSPDAMSKAFQEQSLALQEARLDVEVGGRRPGGARERVITIQRTRDARDERDA